MSSSTTANVTVLAAVSAVALATGYVAALWNQTEEKKLEKSSTSSESSSSERNVRFHGSDSLSSSSSSTVGEILQRPNWNLSHIPRRGARIYSGRDLGEVQDLLDTYGIDPYNGFLPGEAPLATLPLPYYAAWEIAAQDLPKLLGVRGASVRPIFDSMEILSTDGLTTRAEWRRAHLVLSMFAHAYVWGGPDSSDRIPPPISIPLLKVSEKLGLPPVLVHPSIVLSNWRLLDPEGAICMENLVTLNNFFDGRDESWFYLITVDVEASGASGIVPGFLAMDALQKCLMDWEPMLVKEKGYNQAMDAMNWEACLSQTDAGESSWLNDLGEVVKIKEASQLQWIVPGQDPLMIDLRAALPLSLARNVRVVSVYVAWQMERVADAVDAMRISMAAMREQCFPFVFFHRVRTFLSGWKNNPRLPNGVVYDTLETKSRDDAPRSLFHGGSAAQSSLLPFLDLLLGVDLSKSPSTPYLLEMREYMYREHRELLTRLGDETKTVSLASFNKAVKSSDHLRSVATTTSDGLNTFISSFDNALRQLSLFRSVHLSVVRDYIMKQSAADAGASAQDQSDTAGGKGTGGTDPMEFLKPIRDAVDDARKV